MPEYQTPSGHKQFDVDGRTAIPSMELPSFRKLVALDRGVEKKIMITTRGGLGDCICAEPALRHACKHFKSEIYVSTFYPELYSHLPISKSFNLATEMPNWIDYLNFHSIAVGDEVPAEFYTHMYSHVVDYHSMLMWRVQLPPMDKQPKVQLTFGDISRANGLINIHDDVLVHAGRTWESRTIPKWWWDQFTFEVLKHGKRPVLIGAESANGCGTVDVCSNGCLDLRGKLSIMESIAICQRALVLVTNDSSPIHMAATGNAWIGFLSTVKPPDLLMHWRSGKYGWRMENFTTDWLCNHIDTTPTNTAMIEFSKGDPSPWLKPPAVVAEWALSKLNVGKSDTD